MNKAFVLLALATTGGLFAQSEQPAFFGTWRLNFAKSDVDSRLLIERSGDKYHMTGFGEDLTVGDKGEPATSRSGVVVSLRRTGERSWTEIDENDGKVLQTSQISVSGDGRELTITVDQNGSTQRYLYRKEAGNPVDPLTGRWTMDQSESHAPWVKIEPSEGGIQVSSDDGARYRARFDGRDYPVLGSSEFDSVSVKKIDDRSFEETKKKAGQVINVTRIEVLPSGEEVRFTMRSPVSGNEKILVSDRQK